MKQKLKWRYDPEDETTIFWLGKKMIYCEGEPSPVTIAIAEIRLRQDRR
jgi:hypothetical protein